ncbi:hypothetical protein [Rhodobacter capsulatus]|uniref:hypothetical protein n=1 Tax=Rhodobacter capsulatus TaxID=1061 RepID=UPI00402854DB
MKLPLMLVTIAVGALAVMGVSSYREARNLLLEQGSQRLEHTLQTRAQGAQGWADQVQSELRAMAVNQGTARLMRDFSGAWKMLGAGAADNLRKAWVETNPNPEAERWKLDFAGDINDFGIIHRRAHPGFVTQSKERGLADLFFVDPKGRVLYSLRKGPEFAADLTDPALQQSPLARVVAQALASSEQVPQISDFVSAGPGGRPCRLSGADGAQCRRRFAGCRGLCGAAGSAAADDHRPAIAGRNRAGLSGRWQRDSAVPVAGGRFGEPGSDGENPRRDRRAGGGQPGGSSNRASRAAAFWRCMRRCRSSAVRWRWWSSSPTANCLPRRVNWRRSLV